MKGERNLLSRLHSTISPNLFEELILVLLNRMGFKECEVTGRTGDKGIDLTAIWENPVPGLSTDMNFVIQAKRHSTNRTINPSYVRELRGTLTKGEWGLLITTSKTTENTKSEGLRDPQRQVSVIDGPKLIDLLKKYEVGVKKEYEIDLDQLKKEEVSKIEEEKEEPGKTIPKQELLSGSLSQGFERLGSSPIFESSNRKVLFRKSKYYDRPTINYWYGITPNDLERADAQKVSHFGFGCGSKGVVLIPVDTMKKEVRKGNLNTSEDSEGEIRHYHIQLSEEDDSIIWVKKERLREQLKFYKYSL